ncbi:MAG: 3-isopropylmalate dehydrogenase, partial [Candidatus Omnitrophica bacterium]|nr:3-isopropylmalate dehydrogenase [Candidatus Omnitrophota bacterium]
MKTYNIAVIPGDGIGPEVVAEGLKVLNKISEIYNFKVNIKKFGYGGAHYLKTGEVLPESAMEEFRQFDAIYLGAVGHPDVKPGILERGILLKLRFDFEQYINLRPVRLYDNVETPIKNKGPQDIDYIVVRENTGDVYTGQGEFRNKGTADEVATQVMIYSRAQVERCVRYAFELTKQRHKEQPWRGLTAEDLKDGYFGKITLC